MNIPILEAFIEDFFGYGAWGSPIWFIGMEEGGGASLPDIEKRLEVWHKRGRRSLEDCPDFHRLIGLSHLFGEGAKLQHTWSKIIRVYLGYAGELVEVEVVRAFQGARFGSLDCGFASLELMPLPAPSLAHWIYGELKEIIHLADRNSYWSSVMPKRGARLKEKIREHRPEAVVIYGLSYRNTWEGILEISFSTTSQKDCFITSYEGTKVMLLPHPVARGKTSGYWAEAGTVLRNA